MKATKESCSFMKKLQLAVFNTQPPLYLGGVERRIIEMSKRLKSEVDTTVYSGTKAGLHKPTRIDGLAVVPCFSTDAVFPLDNWTFNKTLARNATAIQADIYEAHTASGYGLISAFMKQGLRKPFVQTIHGVLADEYVQAYLRGGLSFRSRLANLFMWQLARREAQSAKNATLIVTITKYSQAKIRQFYDVDQAKIRIVPNGVDTEKFTPSGDCESIRQRIGVGNRPCVLFVGSIIPRKGVGYLVEAAKQVIKEDRETLFVVVGNGPLRNRMMYDVKAANLTNNFEFIIGVSEQDLPALYRSADVFVLPSIQEGQGIVLLEAQSSSKPVVAFNVGGVREAVRHGETGLLMNPNIDKLAEAILRLLSDEPLRVRMGAQGRDFVQKEFSWDACARKLLQVYREAMELASG
jgi:glycosyltransferase involved in cell wall biosynthesis